MSKYTYWKYLNLRSSLSLNFKILHMFGCWPPETGMILNYIFYQIFILTTTFVMYLTSEFINAVLLMNNLEKLIDASFLLLTHLAQVLKIYCFINNRSLLLDLLKIMKEDIFQPLNMKQFKMVRRIMKNSAKYYYIFLLMAIGTVSLWGAFPILDKESTELQLPLSAWYPFSIENSPVFEAIYAYQLIAVMINAATNISMDTTCTGFMAHVCAQLDILNDSFENINRYSRAILEKEEKVAKFPVERFYEERKDLRFTNDVDCSRDVTDALQKEMDELLVRCVHHHRRIIDMANLIGSIFSISVLVQFVISAIIICITMFELTLVSLLSLRFFSMVLYQGCMLMEIILYCWYGNEIILKSNRLSLSAYSSDWINCSMKYKKNLLFIMVRAKIPIKIYAGGFFTLSLESFSAIIRSSWSYFAVLRQIHSK